MSGASFAAMSFASKSSTTTWTPSFVDNTGTGYITWDGAGIGTDSNTLEIVMGLKNVDANVALANLWQDVGARVQIQLTSAGRVDILLRTSVPATLVDWTSTNDALGKINVDDDIELRIRAELDASPTMEVYKRTTTGGVTGAWTQMTGSFTTGPTTGTIDNSRGGQSGNDSAILASVTGTNIANLYFGYAWRASGALTAMNAFGESGVRINPALVTPNDFVVMGPVASLTTDLSTTGRTLGTTGTFNNV